MIKLIKRTKSSMISMFFSVHLQADTAVEAVECSEPSLLAVPMVLMPLSGRTGRDAVPKTIQKRH